MTEIYSVLVVDDESDSLALLTGILAAEGYQVRSANSGKLAMASVAAWLPHLILLDIRMPGMDGFEVCRHIKGSEKSRNIPLMFISAARDLEEQVAGFALGAVDYITKPFQREELLARVRTHLELGRLRAQLENQVAERTKELRVTIDRLRESEERFRNMADTAPVMIWVSGPDKLCTFFNQEYLTFTGCSLSQALGDGWFAKVHPDDLDACYASYSSAFDARRSLQAEWRLRRADGEYRWVLATGMPRFEAGGAFLGYIGSCLDITNLKHAHQEHLAKQKLEIVGTLAGGIAHDFNNLLGGLLAHVELALAELANGCSPSEDLQRIRGAAIRGAEIVRQLMVFAGEETEELEMVGVSAIVEDMLELLKVSVSKHVTVETELRNNLPAVRANASQIRQMLMNLFYNASEAIGDRDGVIRVSTGKMTVGPDSFLKTSQPVLPGEYVQLEVSDTGRGIKPEVQARVFDAYFSTKTAKGHGQGLAVVQGIVQRLHGAIGFSSILNRGTTFQILLPCEERLVESAPPVIGSTGDETLARMVATILVVEDESLLRQGISKMLRKRGLSVLEARDGSVALEMLRARKDEIDVLLLDMTLPGASSREVYEEAHRLIPDAPVIVTSAHSREIATSAWARSIEYFIRKPFSLRDLTEMLQHALYLDGAGAKYR